MSVPAWLEGSEPPVPESFRRRLAGFTAGGGGEGPAGALPTSERLREAAGEALARALAPEGRERSGAFDLLGADAFATWSAESALGAADPEPPLHALVRHLAGTPGRP